MSASTSTASTASCSTSTEHTSARDTGSIRIDGTFASASPGRRRRSLLAASGHWTTPPLRLSALRGRAVQSPDAAARRFVFPPCLPLAPRSGALLGRHDGDAVDLDATDHECCLDGRPRWLRVGEDVRVHAVHLRKVSEIR